MIAEFHVVIGRRGGRTGEPIRGAFEHLDDLVPHLAGVVLQDAGLVQHHPRKTPAVEMLKHLIVRDIDPRLYIILRPADCGRISELPRLPHRLCPHRQWCNNENRPSLVSDHLIGKLQLLDGLSVPALLKQCCPTPAQCPPGNILLPLEHVGVHGGFVYLEPAGRGDMLLPGEEVRVAHHSTVTLPLSGTATRRNIARSVKLL